MIGFFISISLAVGHWFYGRKAEGWLGFLWSMVAIPFMLGSWIVMPLSGLTTIGLGLSFLVGFLCLGGLTKLGFFKIKKRSGRVVRGTEIISDKEAIKWLKRTGDLADCAARIGNVPIPEAVENTGFLMAGATGTGKTLAFLQLLDSARARGHRAMVGDLGGEFVKRYYRPNKDLILNPFDKRTEHWSPFAEMRQSFDAARIAASMIPEGSGESKEWNGYARAVLEGILERCFGTELATNEALVYYCLGTGTKELAELCAGTPAAVYFVEGNERQLGSIRGILASYIKPLTYLRADAGAHSFSICKWIEGEGDGWLFITFKKDQLDAIRKMMAAQIDSAASSFLSLEKDTERRMWFAFDEFAQFGEISQLEALLNVGRQKGACAILGMQAITQPAMVYGRERAGALLAGLSTWTVFRQNDVESADYMSRFLGDEEIRREVTSTSTNKDSTSSTSAEQVLRQRAIMPGELMQMEVRRAIVNVAGPLPPASTQIPLPTERYADSGEVLNIEEVPGFRAMLIKNPKSPPPDLEAPAVSPKLPPPSDGDSGAGSANPFEV